MGFDTHVIYESSAYMELIKKYFPHLTEKQIDQLSQLQGLYNEWNQQINVISRKDIEQLYLHHVLHSMAVGKFIFFKPKTKVLDLGTGGGFPGIPLAILFPEVEFLLIEARSKKLIVVADVIEKLGLENVQQRHQRAEEVKERFDYVLARAVTAIDKLYYWSLPLIHQDQKNGLPNGLIAFKGGDVEKELKTLPKKAYSEITSIQKYFNEPYFEEKYLVYVQR